MKKKLYFLKKTDNETAEDIEKKFHPDWDDDSVFEQSYEKYLAQKQSALSEDTKLSKEKNSEESVKVIRSDVIGSKYTAVFSAAACAVLIIGLTGIVNFPSEKSSDHTEELTSESTADIYTSKYTVYTSPKEKAVTVIDSSVSYFSAPEKTDVPYESIAPAVTVAETTVPYTETQVSEQTDAQTGFSDAFETSSQLASFTENTFAEVTAGTSETSAEQTDISESLHGYFTFRRYDPNSAYYDGDRLVFVRGNIGAGESREHDADLDGFTVLKKENYDHRHSLYMLTDDETGQYYLIHVYSYDYDYITFSSDYDMTRDEINGRPAALMTKSGDGDDVCSLVWDDGCHVAMIQSQFKDLDTMKYLAERF